MASNYFTILDWTILGVYFALMIVVGWFFSKRQTTTEEFFTAGRRMHWLPISLSLVATMFSAVSFLGHPARVYRHDSVLMAYVLSVILITPVLMYVLLPFYSKLKVTTAYEYLEKRFGLDVRLLASALFILKRLFWMSLVALAPSLALSTITGLPVVYCILIIGIIATIYTGLGGMSAVIWTDVIQFVVFMTGQVLIIGMVAWKVDGGLAEVWRVGYEDGKACFSMDWNLRELTFWTMLIAGTALALSDLGADQLSVQRLMSSKDEKTARISLLFNAVWKLPSMVILLGMGVALWAFYKHFPDQLTLDAADYDKIVPYFIVKELPMGVSGLLIAAIFAAAMSSFDSGLNCLVATFTVDWYERLIRPAQNDAKYLKLAKGLTYTLGVVVTVLAVMVYLAGIKSIIDKSQEFLGYFGGSLLGIFLLGVLTRRAKALPTVIGAVVSVAVLISINTFWRGKIVHPYLYCFVSTSVTMIIGYFGSLIGPELPFETIRDYTTARKNEAPNHFRDKS